ncbi:DUF4189 domain-containing protein [Paraburkholderia youngii]|uniref:DUF4189 domain-containing protein n=1 Tax=Paraburkholderia youngii TaxID=2782701 RepID=UPI003D215A20
MKTNWISGLLAAAALLAAGQANAWDATAVDRDGGRAYIRTNVDTAEEAQRLALEDCNAKGAGRCQLVGTPGMGRATVAVVGEGGLGVGWDKNPDIAAQAALVQCAKHGGTHCLIADAAWDEGTTWSAIAMSGGEVQIGLSKTAAGAEAEALKSCRAKAAAPTHCALPPHGEARMGHLFYAYAIGKRKFAIEADPDREAARTSAMEACAAQSGSDAATCVIRDVVETVAPAPMPPAMEKIIAEARNNASKISSVRATTVRSVSAVSTSCISKCVSGDCISKFSDGHTARWQAPFVQDPVSHEWVWDTRGCGA